MNIDTLLAYEELYLTEIEGYRFVWSPLSQEQWERLSKLRRYGLFSDATVCEKAFELAYTGDYKFLSEAMPAGITESVGRAVMMVSGDFTARGPDSDGMNLITEMMKAHAEYPANKVSEIMKRDVLLAFPSYTPHDAKQWSMGQLFELYAQAAWMLRRKGFEKYTPLTPEDILNPNDPNQGLPEDSPDVGAVDWESQNQAIEKVFGNSYTDPNKFENSGDDQIRGLTTEELRELDKMSSM